MRRLFMSTLAITALVGTGVDAAPIVLRALDQSNLSRISLSLGERDYGFGQVDLRKYELIIEEQGVTFDTRQIYPDRLASRVISARTIYEDGESRLQFKLNCDCRARTRNVNGSLVVEFEDGDTERPSQTSTADDASDERPAGASSAETATAPSTAPEPVARPSRAAEPESSTAVNVPSPIGSGAADPSAAEAGIIPAEDSADEILVARSKLLEQLTRAAEQGLLDIRTPEETGTEAGDPAAQLANLAAPSAGPVIEPQAEPAPDLVAVATPPLELPVRSRTAVDRDFVQDRSDTLTEGDGCILNASLAKLTWPDAGDPASEIARLRSSLVGEFDAPNLDQVEELAKLYILIGFGAEARHLLTLYGDGIPTKHLLMDFSHIVDNEPLAPDSVIARASPCDGPSALWRAAADLPIETDPKRPGLEDELVDALAVLPQQLRKTVGTAVLSHFIDKNTLPMARKVQQILQRTPGSGGDNEDLALARLIALNGNDSAADAIYMRIAASRSARADDALLRLVDSLLERGEPIPPDLKDRLAFTAFVSRSGSQGVRLKLTELAARAGSADLADLLNELKIMRTNGAREAADVRTLGHELFEGTTSTDGAELSYAQAIMEHGDLISPGPDGDPARSAVARQLIEIGLPNAALDLLYPALGRGTADIRIAAAEAFLALGQYEESLSVLGTLRQGDALATRSRALSRLGRADEALGLLDTAPDTDPAELTDLAWQAGKWDRATGEGPNTRRLLAAYMSGATDDDSGIGDERSGAFLAPETLGDAITLIESQVAIEESEAIRSVIEEALSDG
ncbi:MAG: hypothetical protein AAF317_04830 [Pseudomonadota bacterium]